MKTSVSIPQLTWYMREGKIIQWYKSVGEEVKKGEIICEIETDESFAELSAPTDGVLSQILVESGNTAAVHIPIAVITRPDVISPTVYSVPRAVTNEALSARGDIPGPKSDNLKNGAPMENQDVTHLIERLELFEERIGVGLEGLFAKWNLSTGAIRVTGEIHAHSGTVIPKDLKIVVSTHDDSGRVIGVNEHYLLKDKFFGLEAFEISVKTSSLLSKIRLYPKVW